MQKALCWWGGAWQMLLMAALLWPMLVLAAADGRLELSAGHVAESECLGCHAEQAARHARSHHAQAMLPASDDSVRARFPSSYQGPGPQADFLREGGRFLVDTVGPDGERGRFVIAYTFGFEPLQQYLLELPGGRLQALDLAWDTRAGRWFWLGEDEEQGGAANSRLHWSGSFYRWNRNCADCHSTAVEKGFDLASGEYATRYAHVSIGCQSCHGPGGAHVDWAKTTAAGTAAALADKGLAASASAESCLGCHARRVSIAEGFGVGKAFLDHHSPSLITSGLYFPDGQIRDEVFEYASLMQSRMGAAGVNCLDCHDAHSGELRLPGDGVCLQCHAPGAQSRFAAVVPQADFASSRHHHHPSAGSGSASASGAACVDCHMPTRTYMKVDPRRDHSFSIPRPDLSARFGVPNACTNCHQQRDAAWAAATMDDWYGRQWRQRPSSAAAFAAAWGERGGSGRRGAAEAMRKLLVRTDLAGIVRGSALLAYAELVGPAARTNLQAGARAADPLVRLGAAQGAAQLPPAMRGEVIGELLADPLRAVRLASLRSLAAVPPTSLSPAQRQQLAAAEADLAAYLQANIDTAEAHELLANVRFDQQRWAEAEAAFRQSLRLDPRHVDAYLNLAELMRLRNGEAAALAVLDEGLRANAGSAELHHARGLARVRAGELAKAADELARARALAPRSSLYAYTHALALDSLGRSVEAYESLRTAALLDREDEQLLAVELQLALKLGRVNEARLLARSLLRLDADNESVRALLQSLQERN